MDKTRMNENAIADFVAIYELVNKTVGAYRASLKDNSDKAFGWASLASACMAEAAWLVDGQAAPDTIFEHCRENARLHLVERADGLLAELSAGEAKSGATQ